MAMHLVNTFVCNQPYDMATCLAMFTNISASVIFISRVEMYFHKRYRDYADAVFGGRGIDIRNTRQRMFRQLGSELVTLMRLQFIVSVVVYLLFVIFLPRIGYAGMVMRIYPMVAAGYFVLFLMYAEIIFLYYFEDLNGALFTAIGFCVSTLLGSLIAVHLSAIFYGIGVWVGAVIGFTVAYIRLRWLEKHLDEHMFCRGNVMKRAKGIKPEPKVLDPEQRTILRKARKQKKEPERSICRKQVQWKTKGCASVHRGVERRQRREKAVVCDQYAGMRRRRAGHAGSVCRIGAGEI